MHSYFRLAAVPIFLLAALSSSLNADQFSNIYAFGDSLSDAGNIYALTGGTIPGAPYSNGRFTNGPVWVQDLSTSLGLGSLTASLNGGNDFAYGDAYSGTTPIHTATPIDLTGATGQISQFQALHPVADPNALYTIWIGSNDLSDILQNASPANYAADAGAVIGNIDSAIGALAGEGAKNFLVLTVTDLGKTPAALAAGPLASATASGLSAQFDLALVNNLMGLSGLNLSVVDTYSVIDAAVANPAAFGFTNVTDPCLTGSIAYVGGTACAATLADQDKYLFWDELHPTAGGHALVAEGALATLTPEPASLALLGVGLFGIYFKTRKRS